MKIVLNFPEEKPQEVVAVSRYPAWVSRDGTEKFLENMHPQYLQNAYKLLAHRVAQDVHECMGIRTTNETFEQRQYMEEMMWHFQREFVRRGITCG